VSPWQASCSCGAKVDWAMDPAGALVAVESDSPGQVAGRLAVWRASDGVLHCRVLADGEDPARGEVRGTRHMGGSHSKGKGW
jgi:hypothetical protein